MKKTEELKKTLKNVLLHLAFFFFKFKIHLQIKLKQKQYQSQNLANILTQLNNF